MKYKINDIVIGQLEGNKRYYRVIGYSSQTYLGDKEDYLLRLCGTIPDGLNPICLFNVEEMGHVTRSLQNRIFMAENHPEDTATVDHLTRTLQGD